MSRLRTLLTAGLALLGLADRNKPAATAAAKPIADLPATARGILAHRYGSRRTEGGHPPHVFGCSPACAQLVAQNRRRALHLARHETRRKGPTPCRPSR